MCDYGDRQTASRPMHFKEEYHRIEVGDQKVVLVRVEKTKTSYGTTWTDGELNKTTRQRTWMKAEFFIRGAARSL